MKKFIKKIIDIDVTAEEQEEQIKNWIKNNIWQIITGIVVGFLAVWSWGYYLDYKEQKQIEARSLYLVFSSDIDNLDAYGNLLNNYSKSNYAEQAQLIMAKKMFKDNKYNSAIELIKPLTDSKNEDIKSNAIVNLANIYLQNKEYKKALAVLDTFSNDSYLSLYSHIKGDIYFNQGDLEKAKEQYSIAINNAQNKSFADLIQIKLDDLN